MSEAQAPASALIVVNFASSALVSANLGRMRLPAGVRVYLVDCFSGEQERSRIRELASAHDWSAIFLDDNRGFGGGVNAGARAAREEGARVIATLNPDATIAEADLERLVAAAVDDPRALISPRIVTSTGRHWFAGADLYLDDGTTAATSRRSEFGSRPRREWATGACFAMSATLWDEIGGFDEEYFLYWEDVDLSHRVLDAGAHLVSVPATAIHDEGGTHNAVGSRAKSETYYYFNIRNRLLYAAKHLDAADARAWRRSTMRASMGILLQGGRRQLVVSVMPWRALFRGVRDGRRALRSASKRAR